MIDEVLNFWFEQLEPKAWWNKDPAVDMQIAQQFSALHRRASQAELFEWRREPRGRLAEIIVLDQFSRNLFRDSPQAFQQDAMALALAQEAVAAGADQALEPVQRSFLYMPYMHSESRLIHQHAERLFRDLGIENNYDFELRHKAIIDRFGRYPHRNDILGRVSSEEELVFLREPGSRF